MVTPDPGERVPLGQYYVSTSLVLGANGQDGSYLVERLLARGHRVVGVGRQALPRPDAPDVPEYDYRPLDLNDGDALKALLDEVEPAQIFHFAAVHGASGFRWEDHFPSTLRVNLASVQIILEYLRREPERACLVYASSSRVFGLNLRGEVDESSPRTSRECLYALTKNAAGDMMAFYRDRYRVRAASLYLFNHDSPRRPDEYFLPRVAGAIAEIRRDPNHRVEVGSLDFHCDWGHAEDFAESAIAVAERAPDEDFVLASGRTWYARELVDQLFNHFGLDYREHVTVRYEGEPEAPYHVKLDKLRRLLGTIPARDGLAVAIEIAEDRIGRSTGT